RDPPVHTSSRWVSGRRRAWRAIRRRYIPTAVSCCRRNRRRVRKNPRGGWGPSLNRNGPPQPPQTLPPRAADVPGAVQASWRPTSRLTANVGLRVNYVKRHDQIFDVVRENATEVAPRFGISYMVTSDARNVLRASYGRLYEQTNGRDYITTFAQGVPVGSSITDKYSTLGNGV